MSTSDTIAFRATYQGTVKCFTTYRYRGWSTSGAWVEDEAKVRQRALVTAGHEFGIWKREEGERFEAEVKLESIPPTGKEIREYRRAEAKRQEDERRARAERQADLTTIARSSLARILEEAGVEIRGETNGRISFQSKLGVRVMISVVGEEVAP